MKLVELSVDYGTRSERHGKEVKLVDVSLQKWHGSAEFGGAKRHSELRRRLARAETTLECLQEVWEQNRA